MKRSTACKRENVEEHPLRSSYLSNTHSNIPRTTIHESILDECKLKNPMPHIAAMRLSLTIIFMMTATIAHTTPINESQMPSKMAEDSLSENEYYALLFFWDETRGDEKASQDRREKKLRVPPPKKDFVSPQYRNDPALQPQKIHASKGVTHTSIILSWETIENASLYVIYKQSSEKNIHTQLVAITASPFLIDQSPTSAGHCYRYNVRAITTSNLYGPASQTACGYVREHMRITDYQKKHPTIGSVDLGLRPRRMSEQREYLTFKENNSLTSKKNAPENCTCGSEDFIHDTNAIPYIKEIGFEEVNKAKKESSDPKKDAKSIDKNSK